MTRGDLFVALAPVLGELRRLGVRHYITGSLASSFHGVPRASIDADVVADLEARHGTAVVAALREAYYVPERRVAEAIERRSSFNVIHLATMVKVDVFVARGRPFDERALRRARTEVLEAELSAPVASLEDTLLAKLEWFRRGGEASERQWTDIVGLLRVGADGVDREYLRAGAEELGLSDLLERASADGGV
jgi:hypothetical protein